MFKEILNALDGLGCTPALVQGDGRESGAGKAGFRKPQPETGRILVVQSLDDEIVQNVVLSRLCGTAQFALQDAIGRAVAAPGNLHRGPIAGSPASKDHGELVRAGKSAAKRAKIDSLCAALRAEGASDNMIAAVLAAMGS
jgi:hypothetical protein